jgi:hypothetical protein
VPFRNTWLAAILFSLVLGAAAIGANLAWFDSREKAFVQASASAMPAPTHDGAALPPAPPFAPPAGDSPALPRGASVGNTGNGSLLGFDGDALYFGLWRNYDNPSAPPPGLYRFALDGTGRTLLGRPGATERIYRGIQVKEDWVYYISMDGISRIRKDGSKHRQLTENRVSSMAVVGDWIYYQHSVLDDAIYRMRLDGGGEARLCREAVGAMCVADDGWIYYANKTDNARLWRMKADGSSRTRLSERRVGNILVVGGTLWFTDVDKGSALYRMAAAGSGAQFVVDDQVSAINWDDGRLYFVRGNGALARCKPDGTELETVAPAASAVLIHSGRLFILPDFEAKTFKSAKLDGSDATDIRF